MKNSIKFSLIAAILSSCGDPAIINVKLKQDKHGNLIIYNLQEIKIGPTRDIDIRTVGVYEAEWSDRNSNMWEITTTKKKLNTQEIIYGVTPEYFSTTVDAKELKKCIKYIVDIKQAGNPNMNMSQAIFYLDKEKTVKNENDWPKGCNT